MRRPDGSGTRRTNPSATSSFVYPKGGRPLGQPSTARKAMNPPAAHSRFLTDALARIRQDARVTGVAVAGSIAAGHADDYSDADLIVVVDDEAFDSVMA